ncbi:MAG TPA: restriction endonuclease [Candidatus Acidoferrum sp.]|nr:restriction endonuclease [Candidatus Acidoferrum sp.]
MRYELVANLIEAMEFSQFREFARQCILQRGYKAVQSDGWSDGGRDIRIYNAEGRVSRRIAFQCSVEWDWKPKLLEDIVKAKTKLGCDDFTYVTNRRIGDAVFDPVVQYALTEEGVHLNKIDKQDLAAQVLDTGSIAWFVQFLGMPSEATVATPASLRTEVADAFVLFSDDANDFRDRIAEHAIMVGILRRGPMARDSLFAAAAEIMDYNDENRVNGSIDRLQQDGQLVYEDEKFRLSAKTTDRYNSAQTLADADRFAYRAALRECLREYVTPETDLEGAVAQIEELLGSIVRRYADYQVAILKDDRSANDIYQRYVRHVQRIEAAVHEAGVPLSQVKPAISKINAVAQGHPVVTRLVAGEIFRELVPCARSALLNALGRVQGVQVVLEPTVVIPLLCYKLYEDAAGNRHLRAARWLFQRAAALGVAFSVPDVYVEECAVHLVNAGRYTNILYKTPPEELEYSENAFVAFYAALASQTESAPQFKNFLELFGFEPTGDFEARVANVTARIRRILRSYNISEAAVQSYRVDTHVRRVAEQDLGHIYHRQQIDKPPVLIRHDTLVLAYMRDRAQKGDNAMLLATWDTTLQAACREDQYDWWCMDPLHAGDLMALVERGGRGALGVDVALLFDDVHLQLASRVWDTIVRIEKDKMFDADLMAKATKFRKELLSRQTGDSIASQRIARSWIAARDGDSDPIAESGG